MASSCGECKIYTYLILGLGLATATLLIIVVCLSGALVYTKTKYTQKLRALKARRRQQTFSLAGDNDTNTEVETVLDGGGSTPAMHTEQPLTLNKDNDTDKELGCPENEPQYSIPMHRTRKRNFTSSLEPSVCMETSGENKLIPPFYDTPFEFELNKPRNDSITLPYYESVVEKWLETREDDSLKENEIDLGVISVKKKERPQREYDDVVLSIPRTKSEASTELHVPKPFQGHCYSSLYRKKDKAAEKPVEADDEVIGEMYSKLSGRYHHRQQRPNVTLQTYDAPHQYASVEDFK